MKTRKSYLVTECAVVGGGLAGCTAALELAEAGRKVDLFVKGSFRSDSNSHLIAGGLSAVSAWNGSTRKGDSHALHIRETLAAGQGLNDREAVEKCVLHFYPDVIEWLIQKGVKFDRSNSGKFYDLHREGGHSTHRIFHVQDRTGLSIMEKLERQVLRHPRIRVHEEHAAIDLITHNKLHKTDGADTCLGLYVFDIKGNRVLAVAARGVFIATGGLGKVFLYTTNADIATGDGFAMCYRAGLPLANMEFIQFHPSVFYDLMATNEGDRRFLLTEALRGAGAILKVNPDDREDFVLRYHRQGSNATRDVVTRAQDAEMRRLGLKHLWLDCRRVGKKRLSTDFRGAFEYCRQHGYDMSRQPVPIIYATHYSNGGVQVGLHGESALKGCYVLGESAYTGLHGATRLASNSAPECVLFSRWAARHFVEGQDSFQPYADVPPWDTGRASAWRDRTTIAYYWDAVRRTMSSLCGISRTLERLEAAREILTTIQKEIHEFYWSYHVTRDFLEVRNIAAVAGVIVDSALARRESRACHYREDFPQTDDRRYHRLTLVRSGNPVYFEGVHSRSP